MRKNSLLFELWVWKRKHTREIQSPYLRFLLCLCVSVCVPIFVSKWCLFSGNFVLEWKWRSLTKTEILIIFLQSKSLLGIKDKRSCDHTHDPKGRAINPIACTSCQTRSPKHSPNSSVSTQIRSSWSSNECLAFDIDIWRHCVFFGLYCWISWWNG